MSNVHKLDCCFLVCGNSKKTYQDLSRSQRMAVKAIAREFLEEQKLVEAE